MADVIQGFLLWADSPSPERILSPGFRSLFTGNRNRGARDN